MAVTIVPDFVEDELLDRSPALARLKRKRLAPSRWRDLLKAAGGPRPPKEPEPWDCCGSSCKPCVLELYREERKVWEEVHPDGVSDDENETDGDAEDSSGSVTDAQKREKAYAEEKVDTARAGSVNRLGTDSPTIEIELEGLALNTPSAVGRPSGPGKKET